VNLKKMLSSATLLVIASTMHIKAQQMPIDIELTDLKLDIATMKGKTVRVTGMLQAMGDTVLLKSEPMDMSPIWVKANNLSRNDRKALLTTCSLMCKATVTGMVGDSGFGPPGLNATSLDNVVGVDLNMF